MYLYGTITNIFHQNKQVEYIHGFRYLKVYYLFLTALQSIDTLIKSNDCIICCSNSAIDNTFSENFLIKDKQWFNNSLGIYNVQELTMTNLNFNTSSMTTGHQTTALNYILQTYTCLNHLSHTILWWVFVLMIPVHKT